MADSPVRFASGVDSLTIEFTNAATDAAGNVTYNVESDLSGDPTADYKLLRAIMDGDTEIFSSPEFSGLDADEISALETRLIELAVADQNLASVGLQRWVVDPMYQTAYYSRNAFKMDNFDPSNIQRNIGEDYMSAIEKAVRDIHENGVSQDQALATLAADTEAILNSVSAKVENQMDQVREFAAGNDVVATIVDAGTEITGATPVSATITNDPQAMYEMFRNLEATNLANSPVFMALDADGQEMLKQAMIENSNWDHRHVTTGVLNYIQSPTNAARLSGDNIYNVLTEGNFNRVDPNRDIGADYIELIKGTIERYEAVGFDRGEMAAINEEFKARADEIRQGQVDMIDSKFENLAEQDRTHDVVARNIPAP